MSDNLCVKIWNDCLAFIKDNIKPEQYEALFAPIVPLSLEGEMLVLGVPSHAVVEYIEAHFLDLLRITLEKFIGKDADLSYKVQVDRTNNIDMEIAGTRKSTDLPVGNLDADRRQVPDMTGTVASRDFDPHLKPEYNFDTFIEGESNKLCRVAGMAVAEHPAKAFNPLFVYGHSGVGKTHLINAIGLRLREMYPQKKVLYVSAHLFQTQYSTAVRQNKVNDFIGFYQDIDALIIDDVQEFANWKGTQNAFFHIFNHLQQSGKQIIMTCDRSPAELQGLEERLITRFKWGLTAELERPNVELRRNILFNKIKLDGLKFPSEVVDYIACNVSDSIRELEGIVTSIIARSITLNKTIDVTLASNVIKTTVKAVGNEISIDDIVRDVCEFYKVSVNLLHSGSRKREIVKPRQVAMYLAKKYTDLSLSKIGLIVANRNYSTVIHSEKAVKEQLEVDKNFKAELETLESMFKNK